MTTVQLKDIRPGDRVTVATIAGVNTGIVTAVIPPVDTYPHNWCLILTCGAWCTSLHIDPEHADEATITRWRNQ